MMRIASNHPAFRIFHTFNQRSPLIQGKTFDRKSFSPWRILQKRNLTSDLYPRLSRQQVSWYLRYHEYSSTDINDAAVKNFVTNKLAANNPIEDRSAEAKLQMNLHSIAGQYLFGMFDGHAGPACAQVISERLFSYIAVMLAPPDVLEKIKNQKLDPCNDLLYRFTKKDYYLSSDMVDMYKVSLQKLASELLTAPNDDCTLEDILKAAFMRLDHDLLADAVAADAHGALNLEMVQLALTGACANVAYIDGTDLFVANCGDCRAVLGQQTGDETFISVPISFEHDANNKDEVERLYNQHPMEKDKVLKNGRLLGDLAPLRAFGDARYKWPARIMKHIMNVSNPNLISIYGNDLIPQHYSNPPYLTAEPEVVHHALTPRDKFLILASDGLWEHLDDQEVVNLIAGHMDEKQTLVNFSLPHEKVRLREVNEILKVRKRKLAKKPEDENVATHLLRMALGPNHTRLSQYLTLPENLVRQYRDDITITVIYFDTEYIANNAAQDLD